MKWLTSHRCLVVAVLALSFITACAAPLRPPPDKLAIVRIFPGGANQYEILLGSLGSEGWHPESTLRTESAAEAPLPLMLNARGELVLQRRSLGGGNTLQWLGAAGRDSPTVSNEFDFVFDRVGTQLFLARNVTAGPIGMRVTDGVIRDIASATVLLDRVDVDTRDIRAVSSAPAVAVAPLAAARWLMLGAAPPTSLSVLDLAGGTSRAAGSWPAQRRVSGAVCAGDSTWVVIASREIGTRWELFHLDVWDSKVSALRPLLPEPVFVATRPDSTLSPTLQLVAINERHVAFVVTIVSQWRGEVATDGSYCTVIADVPTRRVLCRIPHPSAGLLDQVPEPHLPAGQLAALRIERSAPTAPGFGGVRSDEQRWRSFLAFRDGRLVLPDGRSVAPTELGHYAYSSDGRVLALRYRPGEAGGAQDQCLIVTKERVIASIPVGHIGRLAWVTKPTAAR